MKTNKINSKECNSQYMHHRCTSSYYKYLFDFLLTDGTLDVAKNEMCFWFFDIIVAAQLLPRVRKNEFQTWFLKRTNETEFIVLGTNGNYVEDISSYPGLTEEENKLKIIYKHEIPFSDFRYDSLKVFLADKVIYLPSEH